MLLPTFDNKKLEVEIPESISFSNPVLLPALIDPHVHFRVPGGEHKEDWITASGAAIAGGVTTVFDMPNNSPSIIDRQTLKEKKEMIDEQIKHSGNDLKYYLYLGATRDNLGEIEKLKNEIIGVKIFMGASTGSLLVADDEDQRRIFELCAELGLVVAVHAENDGVIASNSANISEPTVRDHSRIRSRQAAIKATMQALELAEETMTKLYICHVSVKEEVELIREAKQRGVKVYGEVAPHHLFLNESYFDILGTKAQMNPPLRTEQDQEALWTGIENGTIDTIGTDHAPHTLSEKDEPYGKAPSGVPSIENYLALLLNRHNEGKIGLEKIVKLTRTNIENIFGIKGTDEWVLVDLELQKTIKDEDQKTKCGWSPYTGMQITGWPVCVVRSASS